MMAPKLIMGITVSIIILCAPVSAQEVKQQAEQVQSLDRNAPLVIPRINGPVTLDGMSNEAAWEQATALPLTMQVPVMEGEPTEKSEMFIGYDDEYLYLAGRCYDREPEKILSTSLRRDDVKSGTDAFGIIIDSFNDNENALVFMTTPAGLRIDFTIFNDAQGELSEWFNSSWDTFWDVKTVRNDEGWFGEMRIPFTSLKYQEIDGAVVMGITVWRSIARKSERLIYPSIPVNWGKYSLFKASQARKVVFKGLTARKPLYITPYLLGGLQKSNKLNDDETAYIHKDDPEFEGGLDVKYGLSNNLTLDVSVNTDFAQVEADDVQINMTRYSLFFPEKRRFFQERSSNFDFNFGNDNRLFHSRRIGISDKKAVRLLGGARIVGRIGPWDVGFLNMQTDDFEDISSENFGVLRLRRQIKQSRSYFGGIVTNRIGADNSYNTAYGVDGIFNLFGEDFLRLNWAQTFEDETDNEPVSLDPARIRMNWERRSFEGVSYDLDYSRAGKNYNPGIGFERRDDYSRFGNRLRYGWLSGKTSPMQRHDIFLEGFQYLRNADSSAESAEIGPGWEFWTKSGMYGIFGVKYFYEDVDEALEFSDDTEVPIGDYSYYTFEGKFDTKSGSNWQLSTTFNAGTFYDGRHFSYSLKTRCNIGRLELNGRYQFERVKFTDRNQRFTGHIVGLRSLLMLTIHQSLTANVQYNSASDKVSTNIRYRFNPREGNDFYIVFNDGLNTDRHREIPVLPEYSDRTVMVKYSYMFNL